MHCIRIRGSVSIEAIRGANVDDIDEVIDHRSVGVRSLDRKVDFFVGGIHRCLDHANVEAGQTDATVANGRAFAIIGDRFVRRERAVESGSKPAIVVVGFADFFGDIGAAGIVDFNVV